MKKIFNNAFILSGVILISRLLEVIFYAFLYPLIGVKGGALIGYKTLKSSEKMVKDAIKEKRK